MPGPITCAAASASTVPSKPPNRQSSTASPRTSADTAASVKPTAFSTASSGTRSRNDCAMVLPVSSRMVKNTAPRMPVIISSMSPICCMNCRCCSASVLVRVGSEELANS